MLTEPKNVERWSWATESVPSGVRFAPDITVWVIKAGEGEQERRLFHVHGEDTARQVVADHNTQAESAARIAELGELMMEAWGVIANAGGGNWENETADWQGAAARWREKFHVALVAEPPV